MLMKTSAVAAVLLMLTAASAPAAPQTCKEFEEALQTAILDGGHLVALPSNYHVAYHRPDGTYDRIDWDGIVGISGSLHCESGDRFTWFDADAPLGGANGDLVKILSLRMVAIGAGALCAMSPKSSRNCFEESMAAFKAAGANLMPQMMRGDPGASGYNHAPDDRPSIQFEIAPDDISLVAQPSIKDRFAPSSKAAPTPAK